MRFILLSLLFVVHFSANTYANDNERLRDSVNKAKDYLIKNDYRNAEAIVNSIDGPCSECNNDSIRVVFLDCKATILVLDKKEYNASIPILKEVIDLYERLNIKSINYWGACQSIAYCYENIGNIDEAERYYRKSLIKCSIINGNDPFLSSTYLRLRNIYKERGDTILSNECLKYLDPQFVSEINERDYLQWENNWLERINELRNNGKYEDAVSEYDNYIDGIIKKKGKGNEKYIFAIYSKAVLLKYLKRFDELKPLLEELILMRNDKSMSKEYACWSYCNLTFYYSMKGLHELIDSIVVDGIDYFQNANINKYQICTLYRFAGNGSFGQQDYLSAIKYFELYFQSFDSRDGYEDYEAITNLLSVLYIKNNQYINAKRLIKRFLSTHYKKIKHDNEILLSTLYHNLGRCEMLLNNYKAAKNALLKSKALQIKIEGKVSEKTQEYLNEILLKE